MSQVDSEPDLTGDQDVSESERQLEVSVTLVSTKPTSAASKKSSSKNQRRTKVFFIDVSNLKLDTFTRQAIKALQLSGTVGDGIVIPFTYHHKGRVAKNAPTVGSEEDFAVLNRAIKSKKLVLLNVEFLESDLNAQGISDRASAMELDVHNSLATSTGIPRVEAMSTREVSCAKIIGLLEARWKCSTKGHRFCYVNNKVHGQLTIQMLSIWADYIHDHVATVLEPPDHQAFDFEAHQAEIDARKHPKAQRASAATGSDVTQAALPFLQLLSAALIGNSPTAPTPQQLPPTPPKAPRAPSPAPSSPPSEALTAFLSFAAEEFGVALTGLCDAFTRDRIGPDVLGDLDASELVGYGLPLGDAYRLKRAAKDWDNKQLQVAKKARLDVETPLQARQVPEPIGFSDQPTPPPPGYVRSEAERAGCPRQGKSGNFCWQKKYPGESEGGFTFWADMPSPSLAPNDPILATPGTVQLRVAAGQYIDVVRAPRPTILAADEDVEDIYI